MVLAVGGKVLLQLFVVESLCCKEDVQGFPIYFSFYETVFFYLYFYHFVLRLFGIPCCEVNKAIVNQIKAMGSYTVRKLL